jgi:hypothetical protein
VFDLTGLHKLFTFVDNEKDAMERMGVALP